MVICAIVGCRNTSKRDKDKSFFRLPSVIAHQGDQTFEVSKKRQDLWIARIKRADLKLEQYHNTRVSSDHFLRGSPSLGYETSGLGKRSTER